MSLATGGVHALGRMAAQKRVSQAASARSAWLRANLP